MRPLAIVQHDRFDGPSYFATWLTDHGLGFELFRLFDGDRLPADLRGFAGLCLLGGPMSANDALPYYPQLLQLTHEAVQTRTPVIGHCLGGQWLSRALGGTVQAAEHLEIGWSLLEPVHPQAADWFGPEPLQLFQWHGESFSIPPGATPLLTGVHCANQAYVVDGMHLGMQFHCEVDLPKLHCWLELGAEEMRSSHSPGVQQADALLPTLASDTARSQRIADRIYARWAQGLAG
ncbi:MAG: type 1 glutamine amidotransferase [Rhodoferax sp.]|nr:type 1 glutamine amidotransferase [Rhodoferax sp.]